MSIQISVIVGTRNRAEQLRKALSSLVSQTLEPQYREIIVVDNASEDNTAQVVAEFAGVQNLVYIHEVVIGISRARNSGLRRATGSYVAFLDDDAIAEPNWLQQYLHAFESLRPRPACIGGRCLPIWGAPRPDWFRDAMLPVFSIYHYSDTPMDLGAGQWLSICNMALPRNVLEEVGGFREDLGRKGNELRANPEIYLRNQLDTRGYVSTYYPGALVHHLIPRERLNKDWFRKRSFWQGRSNAIMSSPNGRPSLFSRIWYSARKVAWMAPRAILARLERTESARFRRECQVLSARGHISGLWRAEPP